MTDLPDSRTLLDMQPNVIEALRQTEMKAEAVVQEMRRHIHGHYGAIARRGFKADEARRMLRLEVDHDIEYALHASAYWSQQFRDQSQSMSGHLGPMQLDGFDVYVVDRLPEADKGWRVVDPFEQRR